MFDSPIAMFLLFVCAFFTISGVLGYIEFNEIEKATTIVQEDLGSFFNVEDAIISGVEYNSYTKENEKCKLLIKKEDPQLIKNMLYLEEEDNCKKLIEKTLREVKNK